MNLLITGASGQLGPYLVRRLLGEGHALTLWSRNWSQPIMGVAPGHINLESPDDITAAVAEADPEAIVHCAAISNLAEAYDDADRAARINVQATRRLAELAHERGAAMVYLSTDLVFDGEKGGYVETDAARPLSVYGRTKLAGEACVLDTVQGRGLVLRLPLVLGPSLSARVKFFDQLVASLREGREVTLFDDEWRTPVGAEIVAEAVAAALSAALCGLYHLAGPDRVSRYDIGVKVAGLIGADAALLRRASRLSAAGPEPRPRDTSLDASKWHSALPRFPRPGIDRWLAAMVPGA